MVIITYYFDLQIKEPIEVQKCYITIIWTTSKHVIYTNEFSQHSLLRRNRRQMCEQWSRKEEGRRRVFIWWKGKSSKNKYLYTVDRCEMWRGVHEGPVAGIKHTGCSPVIGIFSLISWSSQQEEISQAGEWQTKGGGSFSSQQCFQSLQKLKKSPSVS